MKRFSLALMLLLTGAFIACGSSAKVKGSALLATVNGEAVTLGDVLNESAHSEALAGAYAQGNVRGEIAKLRREAVDRIIDRKLLVGEFKRLNLVLPGQYVENMLDDLAANLNCKSRIELAAKARKIGLSMEDLRKRVSERIMAEMVIGRQLYAVAKPTPKEIEDYFQKYAAKYSTPDQIELALLQLPLDAGEKSIKEIAGKLQKDSKVFPELVKAFSQGPNREQGGSVGLINIADLREEFAKALPKGKKPESGKVYGPVKTAEGIYFWQVIKLVPGKKAVLSQSRSAIAEKLESEAREKMIRSLLKNLRKQAAITYYFDQTPAKAGSENITVTTINEPVKKAGKMEKTMVTLKTNYGDIKLELFADAAPKTVENFLEYVKSGFYNGTLFHRVIDNFMIQGGGFDQKFKQKATRKPIQNEADNRLSNEIGTIAMARTMDPHSATAQFFINVANNDFLDFRSPSPQFYGYCVFGKVVEGMDVVNKIKGVKTGGRGGHQDVPVEDVVILEAVID